MADNTIKIGFEKQIWDAACVHKWIKAGTIPCSRVGKLWKFKKSEVDEWVKSGKAEE